MSKMVLLKQNMNLGVEAFYRKFLQISALLILGMKIILHTFKTFVETFHGTSLPPKIIRQFSNAQLSLNSLMPKK
jgi:hypothetical protein